MSPSKATDAEKSKARAEARQDAQDDLSRFEPGIRHRHYSKQKSLSPELQEVKQRAYDEVLGVHSD